MTHTLVHTTVCFKEYAFISHLVDLAHIMQKSALRYDSEQKKRYRLLLCS